MGFPRGTIAPRRMETFFPASTISTGGRGDRRIVRAARGGVIRGVADESPMRGRPLQFIASIERIELHVSSVYAPADVQMPPRAIVWCQLHDRERA